MSLPKTMKAVVSGGPGKAEVKEVPLPNISTDEVLVKIAYAASNPTDWKHLDSLSPAGAILGCDFAGTVVQVGADVKGVSKGDKVGTFVHGGKFEDKGSYAGYAKVPSDMLLDLNGVDLKEGVTFGIGYITAAMAIFYHQKNEYPPAKRDGGWFLVQGGSTSVGLFAVQLAKVVGYKVIATCSPRSDDLVKSFGADVTVDYHDVEAAISKIKEVSGGGVVGGVECVGTDDNYRLSINSFKPEGGLLTTLLIIPDEVHNIRKEVKVDRILMYTIGGYSFEFLPGKPPLPAKPEDKEWYQGFRKVTPELISKYGVKANPVEERGGLDSILAGLADLKAGKVSGRKLVYKIA